MFAIILTYIYRKFLIYKCVKFDLLIFFIMSSVKPLNRQY